LSIVSTFGFEYSFRVAGRRERALMRVSR